MTMKKIGKVLLVWLCLITLVMPFATEVLAATLTNKDTTAVLESIPRREGGKESTNVNSDHYDTTPYAYSVGGVNVLKVIQKGDTTYGDTFYCLNAKKTLSIAESYNYKKSAEDLTKLTDKEVEEWAKSV